MTLSKITVAVLAALCCAHAGELRMGRAAVKITPPAGMPMAGYYYVRLNEGVHDDLHAKALVLEKDGVKAALVACDLVSVPRDTVDEARALISKNAGIPAGRVMISATHSHTGPELGGRLRGVDDKTMKLAKDYIGGLGAKIAESVRLADAGLKPARARAAAGREDSVSFIRRFLMKDGTVGWNPGKRNPNIVRPVSGIDPEVPFVYFDSPDGKQPLATYVNFACHLDTVGGMQFSADYAYALSQLLGETKGKEMLTVFTIGAAGNINHLDVSSRDPQKGHGEAARIGAILAAEVLKAWNGLEEIDSGPLAARSRTLRLPAADISQADLAAARKIVEGFGPQNAAPFYQQVNAFKVLDIERRKGEPLAAEVQVITLGKDLAWVGLPGEIFVELGKSIKLRSPFRRTIIASLANGALGYVPDRRAYPQGAYEVISSRFAPGGGEAMVEAAVDMLLDAHQAAK